GDDPHCLAFIMSDRLLDQGRAHEASYGLAAVGVTVELSVAVEEPEELAADRDAETDQWIFHRLPPRSRSRAAGEDRLLVTRNCRQAPGTATHAPSCFALATAASMKAMPATPSAMPGCSKGLGVFSPRRERIVHSSVRCRFARAS